MPRLIKIGAGGGEITWHEALKDLCADDVLFLEPGFYELPKGITLTDITIKGTGSSPEDTTILGYAAISKNSRYVTLENLCINTIKDRNSLFVPLEADTYLSLRNCILKGCGTDTATIAVNGKITLELYSTKIIGGSISMFEASDFKLEMNDSLIDYPSTEFCALALEGHGTAIINNSKIHGSINTFDTTNMELNFNNTTLDYLLLHGQTWMNMMGSKVLSSEDSCLYVSGECWVNILNSTFNGGVYLDKQARMILQNSRVNRMVAIDEAKVTLNNSIIIAHADFQNDAICDANRVTFNGGIEYEYFLAVSDDAKLVGSNLVLNSNGATLAVQDNAEFKANVLASKDKSIEVECSKKPNVHILGMTWTAKKK